MNDHLTNKFKTLTIGTRVTSAQKKLYKETAESLKTMEMYKNKESD